MAFLSFVLITIRIPNFFDENQTNSDLSVIATPAKAQQNNENSARGKKGSTADKSFTKGKKAKALKKNSHSIQFCSHDPKLSFCRSYRDVGRS